MGHHLDIYYAFGHLIYKVDLSQHGEVSERFKVTVLKTVEVNSSVGSNPTLSATLFAARWADL